MSQIYSKNQCRHVISQPQKQSIMEDLIYKIAITLIPGVGCINGKNLISYCGGVSAVFREKRRSLMKIPGIGEQTVNAVLNQMVLGRAEAEMLFIEKYGITPFFYLDEGYPLRLKQCPDSPLMLYFKGTGHLNMPRIVALVGTRSSTEYGREMCNKLIEGLKSIDISIISGLAYGIDTWAHRASLEHGLHTVGVLGHSLDRIYPYANRSLAEKMLTHGGVVSEFISGTKPDRENFPMRNRIIAGMADAVVVVEAGNKGGALITAEIANSYNRDVFAIPGRVGDSKSEGCNNLIRSNRAALIQSAEDLMYMLDWSSSKETQKLVQAKLFPVLKPDEEKLFNILSEAGDLDVDTLLIKSGLKPTQAANALLGLEFENLIKCMPGKIYRVI